MIDREDSEVGLVVHKPTTVVRRAGKTDALSMKACRDDSLDVSQSSGLRIERDTHQVVTDAVHLPGNIISLGFAVIKGLSVWSKGR